MWYLVLSKDHAGNCSGVSHDHIAIGDSDKARIIQGQENKSHNPLTEESK
jgi:hypothetical protein